MFSDPTPVRTTSRQSTTERRQLSQHLSRSCIVPRVKVAALSMVLMLAGCELAFTEPRDAKPGVDPVESVVGRWRQIPSRVPGVHEMLSELEFRADGTYRGTNGTGTYSEENGTLTMGTLRHPYVLEQGRLITDPFLPANSNIGITGTWTQSALRDDGARVTSVIELHADGTATYTVGDSLHVGPWRVIGGDELVIDTTLDGERFELHWRFLRMEALGIPLYERLK